MAQNYEYVYAHIDVSTGMCVGVISMTGPSDAEYLVEIPVYDEEYILKYYINGAWYEDAEGTIPWTSALI